MVDLGLDKYHNMAISCSQTLFRAKKADPAAVAALSVAFLVIGI
jgi:hypothetical protein